MKRAKLSAGVDEVGRGSLAGPVVAAAVIFKGRIKRSLFKDSKKLSFNKRMIIAKYIKKNSIYGIGVADVKEIYKFNILNASLLAMKRAISKLSTKPNLIYVDGIYVPKGIKNCKAIIRGDQKIKVISAASILAKVYRDLLMIKLSKKYKNYYWEKNFGYGTKDHIKSLKKYGITSLHRREFKPVYKMLLLKKFRTQKISFFT